MKKKYTIETPEYADFYDVLGVIRNAPFQTVKRAYYARAKECHPDTNPGKPGAESEFRLLVNAFDVLSDPDKRYHYEQYLSLTQGMLYGQTAPKTFSYSPTTEAIMDSLADDTLEELIVGNYLPKDATLQTLMLDLEQTEVFMRFREARNCMADQNYARAYALFKLAAEQAPWNILYHFYAAQMAEHFRRWELAEQHYQTCITIGESRIPQQRLDRIHDSLYRLRQNHGGIKGAFHNLFADKPKTTHLSPEEQMVEETAKTLHKLMQEQSRKPKGRISEGRQNIKRTEQPPRPAR